MPISIGNCLYLPDIGIFRLLPPISLYFLVFPTDSVFYTEYVRNEAGEKALR